LIDGVTKRHGIEPAFVVNDLLSVLTPLNDIFVPINKHGAQSRTAVSGVDAAFADYNRPVIMFPAGLCSRQLKKGAEICDLKWNKMFIPKSADSGRTIIPVRFVGQNTPQFYRFARRRERLGLKFNLEMLRLPREMILAEGNRYGLRIGQVIKPEELRRGPGTVAQAAEIRNYIYTL
jgi:1-acyl-sn-glycerol-3-phosphate acyltransferase